VLVSVVNILLYGEERRRSEILVVYFADREWPSREEKDYGKGGQTLTT